MLPPILKISRSGSELLPQDAPASARVARDKPDDAETRTTLITQAEDPCCISFRNRLCTEYRMTFLEAIKGLIRVQGQFLTLFLAGIRAKAR